MSNYYVEYHRRRACQPIVEQRTLANYAALEHQDANKVSEVLTSLDRCEYYIKTTDGVTVGSFFLTSMMDAHHGKIAVLAAHWVDKPFRNEREIHRAILWYVKRFCTTLGLTKCQRTVNLSSSRQLLITKEV